MSDILSKYSNDDVFSRASKARLCELREPCPTVPNITADAAAIGLADYSRRFIACWNDQSRKNGRRLELCETLPDENALFKAASFDEVKRLVWLMERGRECEADGYANFPDKVDAIQRLLLALRHVPSDHINFIAETQWGKTIVLCMVYLLGVLALQSQGTNDKIFCLVHPVKIQPRETTKADYTAALRIHSLLRFDNAAKPQFDVELAEAEHGTISGRRDLFFAKNWRGHGDLEEMLSEAVRRQVSEVIFLIDEADEASLQNSVFSQMVELGAKLQIKVQLFLISGTDWPYSALNFIRIEPEIAENSNYCGTIKGKLTPFQPVSHIAQSWGIPSLPLIHPSIVTGSYDKYEAIKDGTKRGPRRIKREALPDDYDAYRMLCADALISLFTRIVENRTADGQTISNHGPFFGGQGAMLRLPSNRDAVWPIIEQMLPTLKRLGVHVIHYYDNKEHDVKRSIAHRNEPYYLIIVLAQGRRMDRMGKPTTTVFVDLTEEFSTATAMEQGTAGRVSGWNMITDRQTSFCILSDSNHSFVEKFRFMYKLTGVKTPIKKAATETEIVTDGGTFRFHEHDTILLNFDEERLLPIKMKLKKLFSNLLRVTQQRDRDVYSLKIDLSGIDLDPRIRVGLDGRTLYFPLFEIFTPDQEIVLQELYMKRSIGEIELLRPSQYRNGVGLDSVGAEVAVTVGRHERGTRTGYGAFGSKNYDARNKTSRQTKGRFDGGLRPEIHFSLEPDGTFTPRTMTMPLTESVKIMSCDEVAEIMKIVPTPKNFWSRYVSDV